MGNGWWATLAAAAVAAFAATVAAASTHYKEKRLPLSSVVEKTHVWKALHWNRPAWWINQMLGQTSVKRGVGAHCDITKGGLSEQKDRDACFFNFMMMELLKKSPQQDTWMFWLPACWVAHADSLKSTRHLFICPSIRLSVSLPLQLFWFVYFRALFFSCW